MVNSLNKALKARKWPYDFGKPPDGISLYLYIMRLCNWIIPQDNNTRNVKKEHGKWYLGNKGRPPDGKHIFESWIQMSNIRDNWMYHYIRPPNAPNRIWNHEDWRDRGRPPECG